MIFGVDYVDRFDSRVQRSLCPDQRIAVGSVRCRDAVVVGSGLSGSLEFRSCRLGIAVGFGQCCRKDPGSCCSSVGMVVVVVAVVGWIDAAAVGVGVGESVVGSGVHYRLSAVVLTKSLL